MNPAVLWPMKTFTFPEWKLRNGASKLAGENAKCRAKFGRNYSYLRLVAACSKIAQTSVKVGKTMLLPLVLFRAQIRISQQALHWPIVGSLRWDDQRASVTTLHVSVIWAIEYFKDRASQHIQKQINSIALFLEHNFWLRDKYKYGLMTKCEVKMAGYWPSYFFACLWTKTKSRSINSQKKNEANI